MKDFFRAVWVLLLALGLPAVAWSQYNLEELGIELGPGLATLHNAAGNALGPAANANVFYSHYACGKGYGFHITAGGTALFPSIADGEKLIDEANAGKTSFQLAGIDVGMLGKLRIHEYHRPREWALFLGPKLMVPLMTRFNSTQEARSLSQATASVNHFWTGVQLSVQFRQPVNKKTSWFIHPGVEYYFLPAFSSVASGSTRPLYIFLNFGFAFWDQRG